MLDVKDFEYDNERLIPGTKYEFKATKANDPYMANLGVKVNEDGSVVPDESNLVNLDELIQTYKDQCGMELALRLIKLGQIDPQSLADDGNHGFDARTVPDTPQGIANAAIVSKLNVDAIRKELGIPEGVDIPQDALDKFVSAYIQANLDKFVKPTEGGAE